MVSHPPAAGREFPSVLPLGDTSQPGREHAVSVRPPESVQDLSVHRGGHPGGCLRLSCKHLRWQRHTGRRPVGGAVAGVDGKISGVREYFRGKSIR